MFRALQPSEAPGSGGVLAARASAGQRRLSAQGVEPGGRGSRARIGPFGIDRGSIWIPVSPARSYRGPYQWLNGRLLDVL
jgi:hypothetical protein